MDADIQNPSQLNRFLADGMHKTEIVEWNKKRKSQSDQMDLLRPKHKCWVGNSSTEHALMFDENPVLESMHIYVVKGRTDATLLGDSSERESAKDSNSFAEDSNTAMSVNEEGKLEADSAKTNGRSFTSFVDWDGYNVKDNHCSFDVSAVEKVCSSEEDAFVDNELNPSYHYTDLRSLKKLEEHFLGLGSRTDHMDSEYAKDSFEESMDKDFEDILYSKGENPNMYVLSSGRWDVNQEAQSSTRTPTIDQEFEQYFSMLML
ncbi:protein FAR-RED ELONGATED HYPOCOTYL 1-like isoform X1 [Gastrolobium bilobum]|uniref:protein FAR-RED ELONGATED HYPOCOTYL 1-like isoform X1 n=1 Tax=Gastrolobium bilobum TaxID=150636 RepID=UPI002AB08AF8|nr:protein FAR-RED ELONGATED HYPOCOTYL 1-like isoform X1 [Gastrolobium bilobum]